MSWVVRVVQDPAGRIESIRSNRFE